MPTTYDTEAHDEWAKEFAQYLREHPRPDDDPSDGGYLVPTDETNRIVDILWNGRPATFWDRLKAFLRIGPKVVGGRVGGSPFLRLASIEVVEPDTPV